MYPGVPSRPESLYPNPCPQSFLTHIIHPPCPPFPPSPPSPLQESFLEDINNILNSGEVPNLMGNEDMEVISAAMRPIMLVGGALLGE